MFSKIKAIEALDDLVLHVTFDGGEQVLYDVKEDVENIPDFRRLETEPYLFRNFSLDTSRTCLRGQTELTFHPTRYWNTEREWIQNKQTRR